MKATIKYFEVTIYILFIIFSFNKSLAQQRDDEKRIPAVTNLPSQYQLSKWTLTYQSMSDARWGENNYLTSNYYSASVNGYGNSNAWYGFDAPDGYDSGNCPDIGYGIYKFIFDLPYGSDRYVIIDLRDTDYCGTRPPYVGDIDLYIRWDDSAKKFEYKNHYTGYQNLASSTTIWELFEISEPNQEVFQPTKPLQFTCTNPNEYGEHPHFTWEVPDWPSGGIRGDRSLTVIYRIYRNNDQVSPDLTSLSWTDNDATILPYGLRLNYHAKAKLSSSPESEKSNTVSLRGSIAKPEKQQHDMSNKSNDESKKIFLTTYPNPFNPTTNISYYLQNDGFVHLSIFNISGQQIIELVNEIKQAGKHTVNFNAGVLSGGIYFVRFQIEDQLVTKKILLFK